MAFAAPEDAVPPSDALVPKVPAPLDAEALARAEERYDMLDAKLDSLLGAVRSTRASGTSSVGPLAPLPAGSNRIAPVG